MASGSELSVAMEPPINWVTPFVVSMPCMERSSSDSEYRDSVLPKDSATVWPWKLGFRRRENMLTEGVVVGIDRFVYPHLAIPCQRTRYLGQNVVKQAALAGLRV